MVAVLSKQAHARRWDGALGTVSAMAIVSCRRTRPLCSCGTEPQPLQPRQVGFGEIRQLGEIVDEVERQPVAAAYGSGMQRGGDQRCERRRWGTRSASFFRVTSQADGSNSHTNTADVTRNHGGRRGVRGLMGGAIASGRIAVEARDARWSWHSSAARQTRAVVRHRTRRFLSPDGAG